MSSIPSRSMDEDFVRDFFIVELTPEDIALVLWMWEPYREHVEHVLADFNEDEQSWRQCRNTCFDALPIPVFADGRIVRWEERL